MIKSKNKKLTHKLTTKLITKEKFVKIGTLLSELEINIPLFAMEPKVDIKDKSTLRIYWQEMIDV